MFKIKADSTYKVRLFVQGFSQIPGVNCSGTFAPVCRLQIIRMMLAVAVELGYEVHMLDVPTVLLNANVQENCFVKIAPSYGANDRAGVPLVLKLKKIL